MTPSQTDMRNRGRWIGLVVAVWAVVCLVAAALRVGTTLALEQGDPSVVSSGWRAAAEVAAEAVVYLVLALAVLRSRRIQADLRRCSPAVAVVALIIGCGGLFAQLGKVAFYPFAPWSMYSAAMPSCEIYYYEYIGIDADGRSVALNPAALFPSLGDALEVKLGQLARGGSGLSGTVVETYAAAITAIGRQYNDRFPRRPIEHVAVEFVSRDHRAAAGKAHRARIFVTEAL